MATLHVGRTAAPVTPGRLPFRRPPLPILDAYILREMVGPFVFALAAYLLFWFINIFFLAADYIINSHAPIFLVLRFLVFRIPQSTPLAFPFASLFATLLAFGRFAQDNELTALRTSGISFWRICVTPLLCGVGVFALSYYINEQIAPVTTDLSTRAFYQMVYHTDQLPIDAGFFRKDDSTGNVFYVGQVSQDNKTLQDVMIFQNSTTTPFKSVVNAATAQVKGTVLELVNARITYFKPTGEVNGQTVVQKELYVGLPLGETIAQFTQSSQSDPYAITSDQLKVQIHAMESTGQGGQALDILKITLAQRLAFPFASFIAVVLALPLATQVGRRGKNLGMAFGIALSVLLLFIYYIIMSAFLALGRSGALNPYIAAWAPNVIMGAAGAFMFRRIER